MRHIAWTVPYVRFVFCHHGALPNCQRAYARCRLVQACVWSTGKQNISLVGLVRFGDINFDCMSVSGSRRLPLVNPTPGNPNIEKKRDFENIFCVAERYLVLAWLGKLVVRHTSLALQPQLLP